MSREHTWEEVSSLTAEVKCCPMCCCSRICCLRDVKKYFLLFPIMGAGKFQHEAIKIWTDCSSWGEAVLPLYSVFLWKAAFRHAKCQFPAVVFLVCFCSGGLLPAEQTNPRCMQKCICILMQEGQNCTSDEGEASFAEFTLLVSFAVSPWWFANLIGDGASACVITQWIGWRLYGFGCWASLSSQTPDHPKYLFTASCFSVFKPPL